MPISIEFGQWISALTLSEVLSMVLEYVKVLAWPITVAVAVWIFRHPVTNLLTRLTEFSAFGVKSSFDDQARFNAQQAEAIREAVEDAGDQRHIESESTSDADLDERSDTANQHVPVGSKEATLARPNPSRTLGEQDPSILGVFVARWNRLVRVEEQVLERLEQSEGESGQYRRVADLVRTFTTLANRGYVPTEAVEVARRTQRLRNEVVHGYTNLSLEALDDVLSGIASLEQTLQIASGRMLVSNMNMNRAAP